MNDLIFLDTETTGLDDTKHEVWEIAWVANDDREVQQRILDHSLKTADPKALALNHYWERAPWGKAPELNHDFDLEIKEIITGNTLVCANPPFDRGFLKKRWGIEPWHYRSIDLESMALVVLGHERPKGLKDISDELRELGYNISEPGHAAWIDVVVLRESYQALRNEQKKLRDAYSRKVYR